MLKPEHQPLIRVIDDEEGVRTALSFMLTSEGFRVKTYESAQTFLVDDTPSEPGCIIADVRMPGMSGIELLMNFVHVHILFLCFSFPAMVILIWQ